MAVLKKAIQSAQRRERRMTFVIDASVPSLVVGQYQGSLTDNGTGDFTITFNEAYSRAPIAIVTGAEADTAGYYDNAAVASIDILVTDLAGSAADQDVVAEVIGWDAPDEAQ